MKKIYNKQYSNLKSFPVNDGHLSISQDESPAGRDDQRRFRGRGIRIQRRK